MIYTWSEIQYLKNSRKYHIFSLTFQYYELSGKGEDIVAEAKYFPGNFFSCTDLDH